MRHTVHLLVDQAPQALVRAAHALEQTSYRLERLVVSRGPGKGGRVRLTAVLEAPATAPVASLFVDTGLGAGGRPNEAPVPFHWQADGAGDHDGV